MSPQPTLEAIRLALPVPRWRSPMLAVAGAVLGLLAGLAVFAGLVPLTLHGPEPERVGAPPPAELAPVSADAAREDLELAPLVRRPAHASSRAGHRTDPFAARL